MIFPNLPLYDYFAIVGYNPEFGLKQERKAEFGEGNSLYGPRSPLEASYEAKVIANFPRERQGKPFAAEIASLALPCGVRLFTEHDVPREPSFHSFVIVKEDGSRLYGCSLVFYEELRSVELRQQIFDAQMYFLRDFASNHASSSFQTASTTESSYSKGTLLQQKQHLSKKFTTHSLPRKFSASGRRNSSNVNPSDQKNEEDHSSYYSNPKSLLFASKCMVVLTPLPVIYSSENLLHNLWLIFNDKFPDEVSLDDALFWTLFQIPLPLPGESIRVTHPQFQLLVRIPTEEDFPYFDYPMETIFNFLPIEKFLKLLTNFMLEKQILLVSRNARTLMLFGECLSALVFPFSWQMAYCPILPHSQLKFLEAPVPWLMGFCYEDENLPEDFSQFNICFLDIDTRRLDLPEDLPAFPKSQQIINRITALLTEFTDFEIESTTSSYKNKKQIHDFYLRGLSFNKALRSIFLSHFASLFTSYENYLLNADINTNCDNKNSRITKRFKSARILRESSANFDKISFLVDQPESVLPFLSAFLETQMFTSFIDSKILSLQNSAQVGNGILIFDKKIAELKDVGIIENLFSNANDYEMTSLNDSKVHQIFPPSCSKIPPQKYNGYLLIKDPSLLEQNESTTINSLNDVIDSSLLNTSNNKYCSIKTSFESELKKQIIDNSKLDNEDKETTAINTLIIKESETQMNMAHQNWKFVEQLLKETKAKTKRILVAKMGKEAIHLGHGQLHLGISGVEENTLVASFCDLLERIWSHGLKKKQGKSALWTYIISYHEWEKRINNNKTSSRRASSIGFENNNNNISASTHAEKEQRPSTTSNEIVQNINNGESPRALLELITSFRKIAGASPPIDSLDNSPHSSSTDSLSNLTNNWSQSLLKAANVICERITSQQKINDEKVKKTDRNSGNGLLPPLPPKQANQTSTLQNWRLCTPKLLRRRKSSGFNEQDEEGEDDLNKKSSENNSNSEVLVKETYRKFIFQSPLKAVNNNHEERRSRTITKIPTPPRSSSCCQSGGKGNLASRFSEDSLSHISSKNDPTTPKRRPRDLSTSGGSTNFQQQKWQYSRNRSLSRSNSPSRLYERLTRGMMGYGGGGGDLSRSLSPLPNTMVYDLKNIVRMTEIKTDIGFARAFVRIALERKLLYQYLKKLLSNTQLLQKLYKRYSFLRCDDEREQFLFHLLSLNAVDFSCFTNTFLTIKMRYQVLMACGLDRFPDSFVYIVLTGSLGYTSQISLPANSTQFTFDHKNLGILSTLRVGHKITSERSNQKPIKWFLDYVLVRNCVTAQTFYFRCCRWFGRDIDDGALERLLVAEAIVLHSVDESQDHEEGANSNNCSESPLPNAFLSPRKSNKYYDTSENSSFHLQNQQRSKSQLRSPSSERKLFGLGDNSSDISGRVTDDTSDNLQSLEHKAGMAVNALMKHFLTISECGQQQQYIGNNAKLSLLLCADDGGLLSCFNEIFSHGLIQKLFQKIYPWDYVEKVFTWFGQFFRNGEAKKLTREQRSLIIYAYKMIEKITTHSVVGKEGKFNLFMLLCLRDHIFSGLIPLIVWTPITTQFYEQRAFIRNTFKLSYLVKLIGSLNEFQFDYEQSLTYGLVF